MCIHNIIHNCVLIYPLNVWSVAICNVESGMFERTNSLINLICDLFKTLQLGMMDDDLGIEDSPPQRSRKYCCGSLCDPKSSLHRYAMLSFVCLLSFGSYFCYDNPAALQEAFTKDLNISVSQFMNLYAFYSWPNVILSFVGGFLIDRVIGLRFGAIIFSSIIFVGQCLFALGAYCSNIYLMYFARFLFGIGGESLSVTQNAYATAWYNANELNFVFGLSLSVARIGSTVNMNTMLPLYKVIGEYFHLTGGRQMGDTLLVASLTCLFSMGCALALAYFYTRPVSFTHMENRVFGN